MSKSKGLTAHQQFDLSKQIAHLIADRVGPGKPGMQAAANVLTVVVGTFCRSVSEDRRVCIELLDAMYGGVVEIMDKQDKQEADKSWRN
jgi:hypothetical protein